MSTAFNLAPKVDVFPCPNCRETINTTMVQCPFCGFAIDHASAATAAAETTLVSQAVSDASYLRIMLGAVLLFGMTLFVPLFGLLGVFGLLFVRYATVILAIRWWIKYGRLKTTDPDFPRARGTVILVSVLSLTALILLRVNLFGLRL